MRMTVCSAFGSFLLLGLTASAGYAQSENEAAALFKKLDTNADGTLTADELDDARRKYFERLLRTGDKNNDGKLSRDEFIAAVDRKYDPVQPGGANTGGNRGRIPFSRDAFNRLDRNKDGKLTIAEVPQPLRRRFQPLFDRLKKKELTFLEIARAARQPSPAARRRFAEATFNRMDANRDGKVSAAEVKEERSKRYLTFLLRRAGKAANGSLTKAEFVKAATTGPPPNGGSANVAGLLRRFDKNKDGTISKDEATGGLKTNFDRIDRNSDGKLDRAELSRVARQ